MKIAFDIGNVLVQVNFEEFFYELGRAGITDDPYQFCLDIQARQDIGVKTIMIRVRDRIGAVSEETEKRLLNAWNNSIIPNDKMLDFVDALKADGTKVAILSNMGLEHVQFIKQNHSRIFDGCKLHLSSEVGARKPTKLFYQSFLMQHPEFDGCMFLDDRMENIHAAKEFGMDARHFELQKFLEMSSLEQNEVLRNIKKDVYNQLLNNTKICKN